MSHRVKKTGFDYEAFREDLTRYIEKAQITYPQLVERTGVAMTTLRRLLTPGTGYPKIETVYACCREMGTDPDRYRTGWPEHKEISDEDESEKGVRIHAFMRDVAARRMAQNISQKEVAELVGVSRQTFNKMEVNGTCFNVELMYRLASIVNIKSLKEYMITREEEPG